MDLVRDEDCAEDRDGFKCAEAIREHEINEGRCCDMIVQVQAQDEAVLQFGTERLTAEMSVK